MEHVWHALLERLALPRISLRRAALLGLIRILPQAKNVRYALLEANAM
jgi:hypothetical protein